MCSTANIVRVGVAFETVGFLLALYGLDSTWKFSGGAGTIATAHRLARSVRRVVAAALFRLRYSIRLVSRGLVRVVPLSSDISATATATATMTATAAGEVSGLTVQQRLDALEGQFKALTDEVARGRQAHAQDIAAVRADQEVERSEREAGDARAHGTIREFAGSGLGIAVAGVLLFFLAAIATGLPAGTARLICG
jgi:hypothetical protein